MKINSGAKASDIVKNFRPVSFTGSLNSVSKSFDIKGDEGMKGLVDSLSHLNSATDNLKALSNIGNIWHKSIFGLAFYFA